MAKLTMANLNDVIEGITLSRWVNVSPDEDAKKDGIKKLINLEVNFTGATLQDLINSAHKPSTVSWQNGSGGRSNFDKLVDKSTIKVSFKSPGGAPQIDPVEAIIASAKAAGVSIEVYLAQEIAKRTVKAV